MALLVLSARSTRARLIAPGLDARRRGRLIGTEDPLGRDIDFVGQRVLVEVGLIAKPFAGRTMGLDPAAPVGRHAFPSTATATSLPAVVTIEDIEIEHPSRWLVLLKDHAAAFGLRRL